MKLISMAFTQGGSIPRKYSCQGLDISPPLQIMGVPKEAKSLSLIMEDPDVPHHLRKDGLWIHWVLYNIPPTTKEIGEGTSVGIQGQNTDKENVYMGPCPPDKEHRYFFKLYALDITLHLEEGATRDMLLKEMEGHILMQTELMGTYNKT